MKPFYFKTYPLGFPPFLHVAWGAPFHLTADDPIRQPGDPVYFRIAPTAEEATAALRCEVEAELGPQRWICQAS